MDEAGGQGPPPTPAVPDSPAAAATAGPGHVSFPSSQPALVSVDCLLSLVAGQGKLRSGRCPYVSRASGAGRPAPRVSPTLSVSLAVGVLGGWVTSQPPGLRVTCRRTCALPSPSPPPARPAHLDVTPLCSTGLAGQERRRTAFMGEAFIYSGETKYVKGHCRLEAPAAGEVPAARVRAPSLSSKLTAGG